MAKKLSPHDVESRRRALRAFLDQSKLEVQTWAKASGMSESVVRHFLAKRSESMSDRTYTRLAVGASELLNRPISAAHLRGEEHQVDLPIRTFVGAGDEVVEQVDGDEPMDYVTAPPDLAEGEVTEVRGRSMLPAYGPGDRLFHKYVDTDPAQQVGRLVVAKLSDGRRFVKVLQAGSRRGRFTLESLNPAYEPMKDQVVAAVASIVWVKKAGT